MLEDSLDPRPLQDTFARFLARCAVERTEQTTVEHWLGAWHDQRDARENLGNIEHWIDRARR